MCHTSHFVYYASTTYADHFLCSATWAKQQQQNCVRHAIKRLQGAPCGKFTRYPQPYFRSMCTRLETKKRLPLPVKGDIKLKCSLWLLCVCVSSPLSLALIEALFTCRRWWWSNVIVCYSIPLFMFTIFMWHFCDFPRRRRRRLYLLLLFSYIVCVVVQLFKHVFVVVLLQIVARTKRGKNQRRCMSNEWIACNIHSLATVYNVNARARGLYVDVIKTDETAMQKP